MLLTTHTFKALSSKTRVSILQKLKSRRMTLTELSDVLGMHVSTVSDHLGVLQTAGLISRADEGYKWKYYSLTKDGEFLFVAKNVNVTLVAGIALMASGLLDILGKIMYSGETFGIPALEKSAADAAIPAAQSGLGATTVPGAATATTVAPGLPVLDIALLAIGAGLVLYVLYKKWKSKKRA